MIALVLARSGKKEDPLNSERCRPAWTATAPAISSMLNLRFIPGSGAISNAFRAKTSSPLTNRSKTFTSSYAALGSLFMNSR